MKNLMRIGITQGDAAGVGPEIVIKALGCPQVYERCVPVVIGDTAALEDALRICKSSLVLNRVNTPEEATGTFGRIDYIDMGILSAGGWKYKEPSALCGEAAFQSIVYAIGLAMDNRIDAVVTAPINKEALNLAGHNYNGHTEIFADYTKTKDFAMLLANEQLRVVHVSTHCSLKEACERVKQERVFQVIQLAHEGTRQLGITAPRIAVAGLNPHASENGLFGSEEKEEIIPAIQRAREQGMLVDGPFSPDVVFVQCKSGVYDIVVAMYHDQGHIPLKLNGFVLDTQGGNSSSLRGINCTIGLPIVRTSVDHGTAYGKAGEGRANEDSLLDAIYAGIDMAIYRHENKA